MESFEHDTTYAGETENERESEQNTQNLDSKITLSHSIQDALNRRFLYKSLWTDRSIVRVLTHTSMLINEPPTLTPKIIPYEE